MDSLDLSFVLYPHESAHAIREALLKRFDSLLVFSITGVLGLLALYSFVTSSMNELAAGKPVTNFSALVIAVVCLVPSTLILVIAPLPNYMRMKQGEKKNSLCKWHITDSVLMMETPDVKSEVKWSFFKKTRETKSFYLLEYGHRWNSFRIVPKRIFESTEQESQFRDLLTKHTGPIKRSLRLW